MIAIFADEHMGEQSRCRQSLGDRSFGRGRLMDGAAGAAAVFGAADAQHTKLGWHKIEHLTDALAGRMQRATATRAKPCLYIERDLVMWQMVEGWLALWLLAQAAQDRRTRRIARDRKSVV